MDFALLDKESEDLIKKLNEYKKDYVTVSYKDCTIATINHLIDNNYLRTAVGSFPFQNFKSDWSGVFNVTYKSRSYFFSKENYYSKMGFGKYNSIYFINFFYYCVNKRGRLICK